MPDDVDGKKRGLLMLASGIAGLLSARSMLAASIDAAVQQPQITDDASFIARAFSMRELALERGDQGYGAVVVRAGRILAEAPSRVVTRGDPSAHAEMEAIRDAARELGSRDLSGCTLYSSSPACPMCEAAAYWAGIDRQVSGRDARDGGKPRLCG